MRSSLLLACGVASCAAQEWTYGLQWPGLTPIQHCASSCEQNVWSSSTAINEVLPDVNAFLSAYDAVESTALARIAVYATEPWRDLKDTMELALSLAALYQMPGLPSGEKTQLATRVRRLADAVLAVRNDKLSNPPNDMTFMWVEQRTMRGWPHYIKDVPTEQGVINHQATCTDPDVFLNNWDKETAQAQCQQNCAFDHSYPYIDAYHNGHVLQVLALAARFAAEAGHHAAAGTYVAGAAEAMYAPKSP